jgi:hypothetical protein
MENISIFMQVFFGEMESWTFLKMSKNHFSKIVWEKIYFVTIKNFMVW